MFGPFAEPAGSAVMPGRSLVVDAGILSIVQWRIGAPRIIASASCMMMTYDFVAAGPEDHDSPGKTFPLYCVFSNGMSPIGANAGVVTVSFAPPFAGAVRITSCAAPTSVAVGGACAGNG